MTRRFVIPDDKTAFEKEIIALVIGAIPEQWRMIEGSLISPRWRREQGEIDRKTRWVFASYTDALIQRSSLVQDDEVDFVSTLIKGMKPIKVQFGNEESCCCYPFAQMTALAKHFIDLGYHTHSKILCFQWTDRLSPYLTIGCDIRIQRHDFCSDFQPYSVAVYFNRDIPQDNSTGYTVAPILELCIKLKLEEITENK